MDSSFNLFDEGIKVLLQAQEAINIGTTDGSRILNKMSHSGGNHLL